MARLARLKLDEAELLAFQSELNSLINQFQDLQDFDISGVPTQLIARSQYNIWAEDIFEPSLPRDRVLRNATNTKSGLFIVPTIIEE